MAIMMNHSTRPIDTHVWLNFHASLDIPIRAKPKSPASTIALPCTKGFITPVSASDPTGPALPSTGVSALSRAWRLRTGQTNAGAKAATTARMCSRKNKR